MKLSRLKWCNALICVELTLSCSFLLPVSFSQFLYLNPVWPELFSLINRSIVGQVILLVFQYLIVYMLEDSDYTCLNKFICM